MSAGNLFETRRKAFKLRTVDVTADYTVKLGGTSDNYVYDRVLNVDSSAEANIAITLGNGVYEGQRLLINFTVEGSAETITVTAETGSGGDSTMDTAGQYMSLEWVNSTTGWVVLAESVAS